jgi:hypothetical protein
MAQAIGRRPGFAPGSLRVKSAVDKVTLVYVYHESLGFPLYSTMAFHAHISTGVGQNKPVGSRGSDTWSHLIHMNNSNIQSDARKCVFALECQIKGRADGACSAWNKLEMCSRLQEFVYKQMRSRCSLSFGTHRLTKCRRPTSSSVEDKNSSTPQEQQQANVH